MTINDIKFDTGEKAYFLYKNKIEYREIHEIRIEKGGTIKYKFYNDDTGKYFAFVDYTNVFSSKNFLLSSL